MKDLLLQMLLGQVRTGVAALGAYLTTYGLTVSGEMQTQLVGAAMVVVSLILSATDKWWAERKKRNAEVAAAVASVEIGRPVRVTVTPAGQPNEATLISATEAAAAPAVPLGTPPQPAPATP